MSLKKFLSLVIVFVSIFLYGESVVASDTKNISEELPVAGSYNFTNDPFLLGWTFVLENQKELTFEEKTLERWKKKQTNLWKNLPEGKFTINASAYTAAADECGKNDGITASGLTVEEKRTLACPPNFPFGTKIAIEGMGEFRCEDRGGAIKGNKIDIYMETKKEAFAFGRRNLIAEVIK
ncbi:MAG: 3D domain-containing protein [Candidatus Moranbacteria bacterium]|nr:3D domain-containing protein [Candidatus Moranbacteria bacterium]